MSTKYEHQNGNGSLFKNTNKTSYNQPECSGSIKLQDWTEQQIAAGSKHSTKWNVFPLQLSDNDFKIEGIVKSKLSHF